MTRNYFRFYKDFYEIVKDLPPEEQLEVYTAIMEFVFYGNNMTAEKPKRNPNETQTKPNDNPNSDKTQKTQENPNKTQLKPSSTLAFNLIKRQLSIDNKQFINGCKGGRPRKDKADEKKPTKTQTKPNDNPSSKDEKAPFNGFLPNNPLSLIPEKEEKKERKENTPKGVQKKSEKVESGLRTSENPSPPGSAPPPSPKSSVFIKPTIEEVKAYFAEKGMKSDPGHFYDHFESNGWKVSGKSTMKDWRAAARNWERNDNRFSYGRKEQRQFGNTRPGDFAGKGYTDI